MTIAYRDDKALPSRSVQNLFRRLEWSDWFTQRDIDWYLQHALYVLSAWDGRRLVGQTLYVPMPTETIAVEVTEPVFFDPDGERLHG